MAKIQLWVRTIHGYWVRLSIAHTPKIGIICSHIIRIVNCIHTDTYKLYMEPYIYI